MPKQPQHLPQWPPRPLPLAEIIPDRHINTSCGDPCTFENGPPLTTKRCTSFTGAAVDVPCPQDRRRRCVGAPTADSVLRGTMFGEINGAGSCAFGALGVLDASACSSWEQEEEEEEEVSASCPSSYPCELEERHATAVATTTLTAVGGCGLDDGSNDGGESFSLEGNPSFEAFSDGTPASDGTATAVQQREIAPLRVRFSPNVEGLEGPTEAAPTKGEETPTPCTAAMTTPRRDTFPGSAPTSLARPQEGGIYVSADGQCFEPHRNGIHTAWRRRRKEGSPRPMAEVVARGDGHVRGRHCSTPARKNATVGADELISRLSLAHQQQQEGEPAPRLSLRRTCRPSALAPSNINSVGGHSIYAATAASSTGKGGGFGVTAGWVSVGGGTTVAPLPCVRSYSSLTETNILERLLPAGARSAGGETPWRERRKPTPPPERSISKQRSTIGPPNLATAARRSAKSATGDENARPVAAPLSSPAVRKNLARVARASKVGTKADPVTLYRQRQELEDARRVNAAARSRRGASTERRGRCW